MYCKKKRGGFEGVRLITTSKGRRGRRIEEIGDCVYHVETISRSVIFAWARTERRCRARKPRELEAGRRRRTTVRVGEGVGEGTQPVIFPAIVKIAARRYGSSRQRRRGRPRWNGRGRWQRRWRIRYKCQYQSDVVDGHAAIQSAIRPFRVALEVHIRRAAG